MRKLHFPGFKQFQHFHAIKTFRHIPTHSEFLRPKEIPYDSHHSQASPTRHPHAEIDAPPTPLLPVPHAAAPSDEPGDIPDSPVPNRPPDAEKSPPPSPSVEVPDAAAPSDKPDHTSDGPDPNLEEEEAVDEEGGEEEIQEDPDSPVSDGLSPDSKALLGRLLEDQGVDA